VAACRLLISNKTRAIILVTPNNPTGAIYPSATIQEFADLALEHHLPLILDETYRELMPVDVKRSHELFTNERQDWRDVLIHLFSFSKYVFGNASVFSTISFQFKD
jgi:aspartate/methionine/tyrosine aminotransferase